MDGAILWDGSEAGHVGSGQREGCLLLVSQSRRRRKVRRMGKVDVDNDKGGIRVRVGRGIKLESKRKLHKYHHY